MKIKNRCTFLFVVMVLGLLLSGCSGNAIQLDLSDVETDPERFTWGSYSDVDVSLGDVGLFYCKDNTLRFYDMEARQEYTLCSRANCQHNSDECNAYFASDIYGNSADNVAQIGNYVYCTYFGVTMDDYTIRNGKGIQLLCVDLNDGTREVVAEFPCVNTIPTDADPDAFFAEDIGNVDYCNGWAWFPLNMSQPERANGSVLSYCQLTGVNLETGEIVALNGYDSWGYMIECVCANAIFFSREQNTVYELTEEEYFEQYGDGPATIGANTFDSFANYWMWHTNELPDVYEIYVYHIESRTEQLLLSGQTQKVGYGQAYLSNVYGEYDGDALVYELQANEDGIYDGDHVNYYLLDMESGKVTSIDELRDGHALNIAQGHNPNRIFTDGMFFFERHVNENIDDVYVYDFSTGNVSYLYSDDPAGTFRIYGEYNGGYFGKHKDHQYQEGYYWISKEDFYAGNLDAMVHYDAG